MAKKGIFTYVIFSHLKIWQPTQETENAHQSLSYVVCFHLNMFCDRNEVLLHQENIIFGCRMVNTRQKFNAKFWIISLLDFEAIGLEVISRCWAPVDIFQVSTPSYNKNQEDFVRYIVIWKFITQSTMRNTPYMMKTWNLSSGPWDFP